MSYVYTETECLAVGQPVGVDPYDEIVARFDVHGLRKLRCDEITHADSDIRKIYLGFDAESGNRGQVSGEDHLRQRAREHDLIEYLVQALSVAALRCGGEADKELLGLRLQNTEALQDPPVGWRDRVVGLVDYDQVEIFWVESLDAGRILPAECRNARNHYVTGLICAPACLLYSDGELRIASQDLLSSLIYELLSVSQHEHPFLHSEELGKRSEYHGLARPGGQRNQLLTDAGSIAIQYRVQAFVLVVTEDRSHRHFPGYLIAKGMCITLARKHIPTVTRRPVQ